MKSIPAKTATSIRSMSNRRIGHGATPRDKYLRLAKIAFEKTPQNKHLQQAMERANTCESRLAEIDQEEDFLLASATTVRKGEPMPSEVPRRAKPATPRRLGKQHASRSNRGAG